MSEDQVTPLQTPGSGVSPKTQPNSTQNQQDYFTVEQRQRVEAPVSHDDSHSIGARAGTAVDIVRGGTGTEAKGTEKDVDNDSDASATTPGDTAPSPGSTSEPPSRKMSVSSSVTFRHPQNPSLPQGTKKRHDGTRIRGASPPPNRFESHVAFDNIPLGESTEYNPISFTLNVRHAGYQLQRRSRTFMVGVDDNSYSDHALHWLLDELVDDGDEVVCVRVIESQVRLADKAYQDSAKALMDNIQAKNTKNRAISLVLEYAVGKLHNTFQHLIKMYQPSMLIVGTKGRSLDGVQGFIVNRNSFSKYCLQYSPVPVVVVRPTEKREKKKAKRAQDPGRHNYSQMLLGQKHEADSENSSVYELEPNIAPDEEAHRVAVAVGLPAAYDPTIKPIDPHMLLGRSASRRAVNIDPPFREAVALAESGRVPIEPNDSGSESEGEFEVTSGQQALKKEKLHVMEVNEGAALREMRKMSSESIAESIEEESDEDGLENGGAKTDKG